MYRFVSEHTVEEAMLRKANQKRLLDDMVIQKGGFNWETLLEESNTAFTKALGAYDDEEDAEASALAAREVCALEGADEAEFDDLAGRIMDGAPEPSWNEDQLPDDARDEEEEEGGTTIDYMVAFVEREWDFFREWRV